MLWLCCHALTLVVANLGRAQAGPVAPGCCAPGAELARIGSSAFGLAEGAHAVRSAQSSAELAWRDGRDLEPERDPRRREGPTLGLAYSMGFAARELREFEDDTSLRGIDLSFTYPVFRSLQLGVALNYNGFYDEGGVATYPFDSGAVTAKRYVSAEFWSLALMARYLFLPPVSRLRPWIGLRVGGTILNATTFVADRESLEVAAGVLLAPELGVVIRLLEPLHAFAVYQYNFTSTAFRSHERLSYGALQLGVMFKFL